MPGLVTPLREVWAAPALAALIASGACATAAQPMLLPIAGQGVVAGTPVIVDVRGAASVTADGNGWRGWPEDLATLMTPVWVRIRNPSSVPVRIQYNEFTLHGQAHT
jgi:hypothetical protein